MAIPITGSRRIIVADTAYRWRVRSKPTYAQGLAWSPLSFAVELEADGLSTLVVEVDAARPDNWVNAPGAVVAPSIVRRAIFMAMDAGWRPREAGSPHTLSLSLD